MIEYPDKYMFAKQNKKYACKQNFGEMRDVMGKMEFNFSEVLLWLWYFSVWSYTSLCLLNMIRVVVVV